LDTLDEEHVEEDLAVPEVQVQPEEKTKLKRSSYKNFQFSKF